MENEFKVSTVKVKDESAPGGHVVINESDFDPTVHQKHDESVADAE